MRAGTGDDRRLRIASVVFAGGFVLHNADHARRGLAAITDHVVWGGTGVAMVAAIVLTLVFTRHPDAPRVAVAAGLVIALAVSASHLLPTWSPFSDSLPHGDVDVFTWIAVLAEVAGATLLALAGINTVAGSRRLERGRPSAV
jgi:hypothetical protein